MTVECPISRFAQSAPDQPAVISGRRSISYAELHAAVDATKERLQHFGIGPRDRVGLRIEEGLDFATILWSLFRLGSTAVLLSARDPDSTTGSIAQWTSCRVLFADRPVGSPAPYVSPRDVVGRGERLSKAVPARLDLDAQATIIFTSGSSGNPKAVLHTLGNHWHSAAGSQEVIPVSSSTRWAVVIPSYHVGGLSILFRSFLHGGTVVMPEKNDRTPTGLVAHEVSHVSVVPTQLHDWLGGSDSALLADLDTILVGGGATSSLIRSEAASRSLNVRFSYGSTEMASQVATTDADDTDTRQGNVGRVLPFREVRVEREEIFVKGPTLFAGYWSPEGLHTPFDHDGWFATGDLGRFEGDRLLVLGRRDNQFVSGGENIRPEEIEEAIVSTGLTDLAIVVPVADERFGARPIVYVRPMCDADELRQRLLLNLPSFKAPDRILPLPEAMDGSKRDRRTLVQEASRLSGKG